MTTNNTVTYITNEQFIYEIADKTVNVCSTDGGGIYISGHELTTSYDEITNEVSFIKTGACMEVGICLDIVDSITKDGDTYTLEFDNGLADVEVTLTK